jgi:hypothetical protein
MEDNMAICEVCGKEMLNHVSCIGKYIEIEGVKYPRIRYELGATRPCHDCACKGGDLHHWGCDMERCPKCGQQLISCDCENVRLVVEDE